MEVILQTSLDQGYRAAKTGQLSVWMYLDRFHYFRFFETPTNWLTRASIFGHLHLLQYAWNRSDQNPFDYSHFKSALQCHQWHIVKWFLHIDTNMADYLPRALFDMVKQYNYKAVQMLLTGLEEFHIFRPVDILPVLQRLEDQRATHPQETTKMKQVIQKFATFPHSDLIFHIFSQAMASSV